MKPHLDVIPSLGPLLDQRDLILVTGKGGTGKSTLVAALAELGARRRGGALAVEFSSAPRLASILPVGSRAHAVNIDAEQVVSGALTRLLGLPAVARMILKNRIIRLFISTSPAVREMVALDELYTLVQKSAEQGHLVVADLPASGHALSFLATPRAVRQMVRVGPLAAVARRVEELVLDGQRSELVAVALPEELPINETIELMQKAAGIGVTSRTVFVNQVPASVWDAEDRRLLALLQDQQDDALQQLIKNARQQLEGSDHARGQIDRLRRSILDPIIELPRCLALSQQECVTTMLRALT